MIKVIRNPSFDMYFEIYDEQTRVDEIQGKLKARREAMKLARSKGESYILFLGEMLNVE